ncbi:ester cyclase [Salinigranum sp.]|uniref:ester cyclase n=1 Tax=Salinigranum sp. TaxID=1966351 RepID=UPI00356B4E80
MRDDTDVDAVVEEAFDRVWGDGDTEALDELYDADCAVHFMGETDRLVGRDALAGYVGHLHGSFPDLTVTVEDRLVDGDEVMTRWSAAGTHEGEHMGLPPTNADVELSGVLVDRVEAGAVVESWVYLALPEALRQHGLSPHGTK